MPSANATQKDDLGASARRGVLFISLAKVWFMIAGLVLQLFLPREGALGSAAQYGVWLLVLAWVSAPNNVMITATIQTVAHFAAPGGDAIEQAKRAALRMQVLLGGGVALAFFLLAPLIAAFEHDAELVPHLRLSSTIVLCYSFYAVFVGAANGARRFHQQAALDITFSTLRVGLVLGAAALFHDAYLAILGFCIAAALITGLSVVVVGPPRADPANPAIPVRKLFGFAGWLICYLLSMNILLFVDGWWLKRLCTEALAATLPAQDVKRTVDALVGVYGAAQTIARLPYQLILAGAFVVFPVMSAAALSDDMARTRRYIATTLRFALIATCALAVPLSVRPQATLRLLYPPEYVTGAGALQLLLGGYVLFALLSIVGTILNGLGRIKATTALGLLTVLGTVTSVSLHIHAGLAQGAQPLRHAAMGLVLGMGGGLALSLLYLWRSFRATFSPLSILRVLLASGAAFAVGRLWPAPGGPGFLAGKVGTLLCAGLCALVYAAVLAALGELRLSEFLDARKGMKGGQADA